MRSQSHRLRVDAIRQQLDAINFMLRDNHIDQETRIRVNDYYRRSKTLMKRQSYVEQRRAELQDPNRGGLEGGPK